MTDLNILLAGFGGQGLLFFGKVTATAALMEGKEVTWFPSYGPETRGGTCSCGVCVSDKPVASPLVLAPNVLVVMNLPSYRRFIGDLVPGGLALIDSSMAQEPVTRTDIRTVLLPATQLATDAGLLGLANMILLGRLFRELRFCRNDTLREGLRNCVPARKAAMLDANLRALEIGKSR